MATELIGAAGMTNELKQTYDRILLSVAEKNAIFMQYGVKKPIPAKGGKSIEFRRFERIDVNYGSYTLTEGTLPALVTQATISSVTCTISQYGQFAYISDVLETQAFDPLIEEYTKKFGLAMVEGLDIVVRNELTNCTTLQYAGAKTCVGTAGASAGGSTSAVGSGDYLDAAELLEADRTLSRAGARKANGRWTCFIHPDNKKDLFEDPDIVDAFQYAEARGPGNPLFSGVLGDWMGIRFVETNQLRIRSSYGFSGADIYEVFIIGDEAYGVSELSSMAARTIIHPRGSGGHVDPLEQYSTIGWKAALAAKILNNSFMVKILCASSKSTTA